MPGMKNDMGGSAAVLGAFKQAVSLGSDNAIHAVRYLTNTHIDGERSQILTLHTSDTDQCRSTNGYCRFQILCLAENSVASNATRPDDIHTLYR